MASEKQFLRVEEAAEYLGVARSTLHDQVVRGVVPSLKVGTRRLIPKAALDQWVAEQVDKNRR